MMAIGTVDDLIAYARRWCGATDTSEARYVVQRGDLQVTAWTAHLAGAAGWWWAVTPIGERRVVTMGWSAGGRTARDADIAAALARTAERDPTQELAS